MTKSGFWVVSVFLIKAAAVRDALNALKSNLEDPNNVLQSWNATLVNPCTWYHVTCNSDNSVTRVDLVNANLSGQLVPQLGQLTNLQYLRLNNNSLTGTIPMSLTTVMTLQVLDLSNNHLRGDIPVNGSFSLFYSISFNNNDLNQIPVFPPPPISPTPTTSSENSATGAIAGGVAAGSALLFAVFLRELQVATDNFSNKNILGSGGFGKVYKGSLADGSLVAHGCARNLLRLHGFCMTPTERLLVYPFMVNGSVASCLRERADGQSPLNWPIRKQIALGSARGLLICMIIHIVGQRVQAVVGDFGLAKLMDYKDTHVTTAVCGTIGHIAPEYLSSGKSSEKTDVFGYGVMLLELITGQRAFDPARLANDDDVMLLDWVKELLNNKKLETLVDSKLQGYYIVEEVEELIQVALLCTLSTASDRPKMSDVQLPSINWIINDSTPGLHPEELSGPR
ncbi:hypothetical protein AAG906_022065 [Vitis piasezkii]